MVEGRDKPLHSNSAGDISAIANAEPPSSDSRPALRSFFLAGPAGRLEALLNEGEPNALFAALVCHPHPLGGGTLHNKVVYHSAKVFSSLGWPVLRFNFRGTGISEGSHDGREEVNDVRAALDWLARQYALPIVAAGFSFGAAMGLEAACSANQVHGFAKQVHGFAAFGLPTQAESRSYAYPFLPQCRFPKLFLSGDRDQYAPVDQLRAVVSAAPEPKQLELIAGADHFFTGHLPEMQSALRQWLTTQFIATASFSPSTSEMEESLP